MKYLKKYENYNQDKYIYHYTMIETAIKIINDGEIKQREFSIANKYLSNYEAEDYGYISFTEDPDYHEVTIDIPVEVRFVFDKSKLEKKL